MYIKLCILKVILTNTVYIYHFSKSVAKYMFLNEINVYNIFRNYIYIYNNVLNNISIIIFLYCLFNFNKYLYNLNIC